MLGKPLCPLELFLSFQVLQSCSLGPEQRYSLFKAQKFHNPLSGKFKGSNSPYT